MKRVAAVVVAVMLSCGGALSQADPVVKTGSGSLSGTSDSTAHVTIFKGVPFAAPPVGDLRWREPQPVKSWNGVRDASKFGPSCMQRVHGDFLPWTREYLVQNEVSEDCLYLNVWTPKVDSKAKLPVLVYIPGGGFVEGSGEVPIYDGTNLASKGLVVVTVNYRLGALGFFAYPELTAESPHHSSGNYGILDQIAALEWVQKNIVAFGGDPHRVTLWGQSAGAFSVGVLLASPQAKGLFQRAMADSGLSIAGFPMNDLHTAEQQATKYAAEHHVNNLKELRAIPADQLVSWAHFGPVIDGWLLPQAPSEMNSKSGGDDVPVITGYQSNDGMLFLPPMKALDDHKKYAESIYGTMASEFKSLYPASTLEEMKKSIEESTRDRERVAMFLWAKQRKQNYKSPVYTYFFERAIPWPQHPEFGAFHSGELPYFFDNLHVLVRPWEPVDRDLSQTASGYLKAFAATGDPNGSGLPKWAAVHPETPVTQAIGEKIGPIPLADKGKYEFWVRFFESKEAVKAPLF